MLHVSRGGRTCAGVAARGPAPANHHDTKPTTATAGRSTATLCLPSSGRKDPTLPGRPAKTRRTRHKPPHSSAATLVLFTAGLQNRLSEGPAALSRFVSPGSPITSPQHQRCRDCAPGCGADAPHPLSKTEKPATTCHFGAAAPAANCPQAHEDRRRGASARFRPSRPRSAVQVGCLCAGTGPIALSYGPSRPLTCAPT